ncbi:MAG: helix-hairpin-helix domain-containing protein [Nocardioidaceae bacterium]
MPTRWQEALRGAGITSQHVTVVALMVAAALAVTAWWLVQSHSSSTLVAGPPVINGSLPSTSGSTPPTAPATPVPTGPGSVPPTASASSQGTVVVDVAGKVRRPGIVTLPSGSRVVDALKAAGGARRGVDLTLLNLARPLVDGEQILVGLPPVAAAPSDGHGGTPSGSAGSVVNLNTATAEQLDTLPGVGPVTAGKIIDWRAANGAFTSVDELLEVDGIGDATLADLRPLVTV